MLSKNLEDEMKKYLILLFILNIIGCVKENRIEINQDYLIQNFKNYSNEFGGIIGVAAKNFKTNETIVFNADSLFPTASVIKLPILIEYFFKVKNKEIKKDSDLMVPDSVKVKGSGILRYLSNNVKIKTIDAATLMIIESDNTATNLILDIFGKKHDDKLNAVNLRMDSLGLKNTRLLNKVFSYATKKKTPEAIRFGLGYSTPNEMLKLLEMLYYHKIVDSSYSEEILNILKNQQDDTMMRRFLPYNELKENEEIIVANKTGAVDESRIDVGIVYSPKADFAIAIFTDKIKDKSWSYDNSAILAIGKITRLIYKYFTQM